jgi:hypothetical protein
VTRESFPVRLSGVEDRDLDSSDLASYERIHARMGSIGRCRTTAGGGRSHGEPFVKYAPAAFGRKARPSGRQRHPAVLHAVADPGCRGRMARRPTWRRTSGTAGMSDPSGPPSSTVSPQSRTQRQWTGRAREGGSADRGRDIEDGPVSPWPGFVIGVAARERGVPDVRRGSSSNTGEVSGNRDRLCRQYDPDPDANPTISGGMNNLRVIPELRSRARNPDSQLSTNEAERCPLHSGKTVLLDSGLRCAAPE